MTEPDIDQRDLFGEAPKAGEPALPPPPAPHTRHRKTDPDTSKRAARMAAGKISQRQRAVLLEYLKRDMMTDFDLEEALRDHGSTYRTRRQELTDGGLIEATEYVKVQKGTERAVWKLTALGRRVAESLR